MDLGISGRRAAVAAGSAGLGLATARALAAEGVAVAICGRDPDRLSTAAAGLGGHVVTVVADLSEPAEGARFVAAAKEALGGPIDIVVANAGGPPPGRPTATDVAGYRAALELNCLSTIAMCLEAAGPMRERGWGRILAVTSIGARQPIEFLAASSVARAAVTSFIKTLSSELAPHGITANTIQPGSHATDRIAKLGAERSGSLTADIPAGHLGDPADFGAVAAFLCAEQAKFICGASIIVDGGAARALQ